MLLRRRPLYTILPGVPLLIILLRIGILVIAVIELQRVWEYVNIRVGVIESIVIRVVIVTVVRNIKRIDIVRAKGVWNEIEIDWAVDIIIGAANKGFLQRVFFTDNINILINKI